MAGGKPGSLPAERGLLVVVDQSGPGVVLRIEAGKPFKYTSFAVDSPPRRIIDILGEWTPPDRTLIPIRDDQVRVVRLGHHPEKVRLVIDYAAAEPAPPQIVQQGQSLEVRFPGRGP